MWFVTVKCSQNMIFAALIEKEVHCTVFKPVIITKNEQTCGKKAASVLAI